MHREECMRAALEELARLNHGLLGVADLIDRGEHERVASLLRILALESDQHLGRLMSMCGPES